MAERSFRFLHASDLHLDRTLSGVADVPDHLVDLFLDARLHAADQLVQAAMTERVDFLILAGHIVNVATADVRALGRLTDSFHRLDDAGIDVYWLDTPDDRADAWPCGSLPDNVTILSSKKQPSHVARRGGHVLANLVCVPSSDGRIQPARAASTSSRLTIAVAHGECQTDQLGLSGVDYWALGGRHQPEELSPFSGVARYSGTTQGECPAETGAHGALVVDVSGQGTFSCRHLPMDVARWYREEVGLPDQIHQAGLLHLLRDRALWIANQASGRVALVQWIITDGDQARDTASDQLAAQLRQGIVGAEILTALRSEFGNQSPPLWSISLQAEPPAALPEGWYEEDTILGDLLRVVQLHQQDTTMQVDVTDGCRLDGLPDDFTRLLRIQSAADRKQLLRGVAVLGVDLLRGERILSDETDHVPWSTTAAKP